MTAPHLSRRNVLAAACGLAAFGTLQNALAAEQLTFDGLYGSYSPLGLEFSDKVKTLTGKQVKIRGFMAPPLKAEAQFFVLSEIPMALCPFCSTDSDWPDNIMVVYLNRKQTFTQPNQMIEVTGILERGSWTDPETGFVSQIRLRDARYKTV